MEIFKAILLHEVTYFVQVGDTLYVKSGEANITNGCFSIKFFREVIANGKIKIATNPPSEIINEFEVFRTKLILGLPYEDI